MARNVSWYGAEMRCRENGGHLWSVNSHEEWINIYESINLVGGFLTDTTSNTEISAGMGILLTDLLVVGMRNMKVSISFNMILLKWGTMVN